MPAPKFEDLIAEMEDGGVDPTFIERAKEAFAASPLRQELREAKAEAAAAIERAAKAETGVLGGHFEALGIKAKPTAFALPADLDRLDRDAVASWAVDQGLIDPPQPKVADDTLDAQDRIADAAVGAGASALTDQQHAVLAAGSEAEFWSQAEAAGLTAG